MKNLFGKLLCLALPVFMLASCDTESTSSMDGNNQNTDQLEDNATEEVLPTTFEDVATAIENSKPTRANTLVNYYVPSVEVTLNFSSKLTIEYSTPIKAEYIYSVQHLNPIGSDEMISTVTGTNYVVGNSVGELENGEIKWATNLESKISLLNFTFTEDLFVEPLVENTRFAGVIKEDKVNQFFNKAYQVKDVKLAIILTEKRDAVKTINLTYTDLKNSAKVETTTSYQYSHYEVNVEGI